MADTPTTSDTGYSPPISIDLTLHGQRYEVASVGPDRLYLSEPANAPPGRGVVRLTVDGRSTFTHVELPDGLDPSNRKQAMRLVGTPSDAVR
jgi:hypothetical protein